MGSHYPPGQQQHASTAVNCEIVGLQAVCAAELIEFPHRTPMVWTEACHNMQTNTVTGFCVCIWTDSCLTTTTFHISETDKTSVLAALHSSSCCWTFPCSDSDVVWLPANRAVIWLMTLQGKMINLSVNEIQAHPVTDFSSHRAYTNSTTITLLDQKNKVLLVYFYYVNMAFDICCFYGSHLVIDLSTWHYYYYYMTVCWCFLCCAHHFGRSGTPPNTIPWFKPSSPRVRPSLVFTNVI